MLTLLAPIAALAQSVPPPVTFNDPFFLFFEYASADVGARHTYLLTNIGKAVREFPSKRVEIVGHADRKGSAISNLALSRRRAEAIKAALVRQGIPEGMITVAAVGEARPIVETADGMAEAKNRFVTVMIY
jgi:outer membrane protein OmpA-like peptidoglycan-associated protein